MKKPDQACRASPRGHVGLRTPLWPRRIREPIGRHGLFDVSGKVSTHQWYALAIYMGCKGDKAHFAYGCKVGKAYFAFLFVVVVLL